MFKKFSSNTSIISNPDLVEERRLPKSQTNSLPVSVVKSLTKTIDEFFEEQKLRNN